MAEEKKEYDYDRSKFIATDEDFEVFINACLDESPDYVEVFHKDTLYVWKKASKESNINIVRLKTEFPEIEPEVLYDVLVLIYSVALFRYFKTKILTIL